MHFANAVIQIILHSPSWHVLSVHIFPRNKNEEKNPKHYNPGYSRIENNIIKTTRCNINNPC